MTPELVSCVLVAAVVGMAIASLESVVARRRDSRLRWTETRSPESDR